jgi:DNA-binding NtrC family response regulator
MGVFASHCWLGNIRELQNFIERSVILTPGNTLRPPRVGLEPPAQAEPPEHPVTLEDNERDLICRTLKQTNGIIDGSRSAAAFLDVKRTTLYSRMQKLGISRKKSECNVHLSNLLRHPRFRKVDRRMSSIVEASWLDFPKSLSL